jgi:hypothetical protein
MVPERRAGNGASYMKAASGLRPRKAIAKSTALAMIAAPPVVAGGRGVGTSLQCPSVAITEEAGWHARLSSGQR